MLQKNKEVQNPLLQRIEKKFDFIQTCAKKVSWVMKINFTVHVVMLI